MEFKINGMKWKIRQKPLQEMLDEYNENTTQKATYLFGSTLNTIHEIWINKDTCYDQQIMTLAHELTHCWIWNNGMAYLPSMSEETVCEVVTSCYKFVNDTVEMYKKYIKGNKNDEDNENI